MAQILSFGFVLTFDFFFFFFGAFVKILMAPLLKLVQVPLDSFLPSGVSATQCWSGGYKLLYPALLISPSESGVKCVCIYVQLLKNLSCGRQWYVAVGNFNHL